MNNKSVIAEIVISLMFLGMIYFVGLSLSAVNSTVQEVIHD